MHKMKPLGKTGQSCFIRGVLAHYSPPVRGRELVQNLLLIPLIMFEARHIQAPCLLLPTLSID